MLLMVVKIVLRDDGRQVFDKMPQWLYIVCLQTICHNASMAIAIYIYELSVKKFLIEIRIRNQDVSGMS